MLVFFSDIHLTDGTSGETINAGAFDIFADQVADLAKKRKAKEVKLVLLGDGFDIIRSGQWPERPDPHGGPGAVPAVVTVAAGSAGLPVRPWDAPTSTGKVRVSALGGQSQALETLTVGILQTIFDNNREALDFLMDIPRRVAERTNGNVPAERVRFEYVVGNHDWLVNRYPATRRMIVNRLRLDPQCIEVGLPLKYDSPKDEHDVVARHGDLYDPLNYDATAGRDASSLGDAIVIELLNRFPLEVRDQWGKAAEYPKVILRLKEIDNIQPLALVPGWVVQNTKALKKDHPEIERAIQIALRRCIDGLVHTDEYRAFCRHQLKWSQRRFLNVALDQLKNQKAGVLDFWTQRLVPVFDCFQPILRLWPWLARRLLHDYAIYAQAERLPDGDRPRYVVYGHTHHAEMVPLGSTDPQDRGRFYMNSGTWRTVWHQGNTLDGSRHFDAWKVMTYIAFYSPDEADGKHEFEMWDGSLRQRRP